MTEQERLALKRTVNGHLAETPGLMARVRAREAKERVQAMRTAQALDKAEAKRKTARAVRSAARSGVRASIR